MKRVFLGFLILAMLIAPAQIFAKDNTLPDDVYVIEYLGIAAGLEDNLSDGISRGEFLSMALKTARIELLGISDEPIFTDVTEGHTYADVISTAYELGIISGHGDGRFCADDYITIDEAVVMLINAMGYRYEATAGATAVYDRLARLLGLLDDITYERAEVLTKRNAAIMIYNALNSPEVGFESAGLKVDVTEDRTFMEKVWDLYSVKGVVDTTGNASAAGRAVVSDEAYIDDVRYNTENFNVNHLLGFAVKAFYYDIDDEKSFVYVYPTNRNKVVTITDEELDTFKNNKFTFENNSKKTEYKINSATSVVWNNKLLTSSEFDEKLNSKSAEFTFINNDGDGEYDYVIVKDAVVYAPNLLDAERLVIGAENMPNIDITEYNSYSISDVDGMAIDFSDIKMSYVVLIYDSGDKNTHLEITVIKDSASYTIESIAQEENIVTLSDGEEYTVSPNSAYPITKLELNVTYGLYFDKLGRIVYAKVEKRSGYTPIYLMRIVWDENEQLIIRALNVDGEITRYDVADNAYFRSSNGAIEKFSEEEIYAALGGNSDSFVRQLVLVRLNSKNEINAMYTISESENLTFFNPHPKNHNAYRWLSSQYSFENLIQLKSSTKIFFVPNPKIEKADDEFFYVGDVSLFRNDTAYQNASWYPDTGYGFKPVTIQPGSLESDYMVIECPDGKTFSAGSSCYGIVTKVMDTYNEAYEEVCKKVVVLNMSGVEQSFDYFQTGDVSKVGLGDIVQIQYNSTKIYDRDIYMYYDYSKNKWDWYTNFDNTIGWRYYAGFRVTKGSVIQTDNGIAKCEVLTTGNTYQNEYIKYNTSKIVKFEGTKGSYTLMDGNNIKPGDKFFAMLSGGVSKMFVFYEDLPR